MKVFYNPESGQKVPIKAWTDYVPVEADALKQAALLSSMPFAFKHVALMPDVHVGIGATVGSVVATKGAIIPAAVGVDIGCGMMAQRLKLKASDLPESLKELRAEIERRIPHGRTNNGGKGDRGAWHDVPEAQAQLWKKHFNFEYTAMCEKHPGMKGFNTANHLGTLGGGNHFVELCLDENQDVWLMLHSGSRGLGNKIGQYFIDKAKEQMQKWFVHLPHEDLAFLPYNDELYHDYWAALQLAQDFALINRSLMMTAAFAAVKQCIPKAELDTEVAVNCHHNYASVENHYGENVTVTRKGAVRARKGDMGIIPGSMGARSFIVRGLGNAESFCSCSHGAGRVMSRTEAKKLVTLEQHVHDTQGVECRKDKEVIDESPRAYKNIDDVMKSQQDLVEIVHTLKQVLCVKG